VIIDIPDPNGRDVVVVNVLYPAPHVPDYLEIRPHANEPFSTFPKDHPFQGLRGDLGNPRKIKEVAQLLLSKKITKEQAEERINVALRQWAIAQP
jgi:hypothetical protein